MATKQSTAADRMAQEPAPRQSHDATAERAEACRLYEAAVRIEAMQRRAAA